MEQEYNEKMRSLGYDYFVCDIFANWEDVKDEILLPERKEGIGNGTIHVFLGAAYDDLQKEFGSYFNSVANGEDTSVGAVRITHYFLVSNVISMLGYLCQYDYKKHIDFSNSVRGILHFIDQEGDNNGILSTYSLFKLSVGASKLRPYFKQFEKKGVFTELIRQILLPNSAYKISLYKNDKGEYAAFWLIGFDWQTNFEANSSAMQLKGHRKATDKARISKYIQAIYYGAPGTGKSYGIKEIVGTSDGKEESPIKDDNNIRITFHPDTDYASFVGCYKPMRDEDDPKLIVYKYQPQAFVKAYVNAWTIYLDDLTEDKNYYLIIEEINRGNCAQIFGDMFQLLDREDSGYSSYKVSPDSDLQMYLEEAFKDVDFSSEEDGEELQKGTRMQLPPNLTILATMNTSDQSLFPMDSAFKRRWNWDYVKIDTSKVKELYFKVGDSLYSWADFVNSINKYIQDNNGSTAKQIGPWFAKADDDEVDGKPTTISYDKFCSKVLFYLFNDALRDFDPFGTLFQTKDDDDSVNFFFENLFEKEDKGVANVEHFLEELPNQTGIKIEKKSTEGQDDTTDEGQDD